MLTRFSWPMENAARAMWTRSKSEALERGVEHRKEGRSNKEKGVVD